MIKTGEKVQTGKAPESTLAPAPSFFSPVVQPKHRVGPADDPMEREADHIADEVVADSAHFAGATGGGELNPSHPNVSRMSEGSGATGFSPPESFSRDLGSRQGGGQPLPNPIRTKMERGIGADFSQVRLHTDQGAAQLSRSIDARAFTSGKDIFFNRGEYRPGSTGGDRLLAHELVHTVQQGASSQLVQRVPLSDRTDCGSDFLDPWPAKVTDGDGVIVYEPNGAPTNSNPSGSPARGPNNETLRLPKGMHIHAGQMGFGGYRAVCLSPVGKDFNQIYWVRAAGIAARTESESSGEPQHDPILDELPPEHQECRADTEYIGNYLTGAAKVTAPKGIRLHTTPDAGDCDYHARMGVAAYVLPKDTELWLLAEGNWQNEGWTKVESPRGLQGWIESRFIQVLDISPHLDAVTKEFYAIQKGDKLENVVREKYKGYPYTTGNDRRTIVHAFALLNEGSPALYFEGSTGSWKDIFDPGFAESRDIYQTIKLKAGMTVRLPSMAYIDLMRDLGKVGTRPDWMNAAISLARSVEGFLEGVVVGFVKGAVDTVKGLWDLIKGLLTGELIKQAYELYKQIEKKGMSFILELLKNFVMGFVNDFQAAWNNPNPYQKWKFFGELIGLILFEVAMAYLTAGAGLSRHLAKFDKIMDALPALRKVTGKLAGKMDDLPSGKINKGKLAKTESKLDELGEMTGETKKMLRDPAKADVLESLADNKLAAKALKLCNSPCFPDFADADHIEAIERILRKSETHGVNIDYDGLKQFFHKAKTPDELGEKIEVIQHHLDHVVDSTARGRDPYRLDILERTETLRNAAGVASGGTNLRRITSVDQWIPNRDFRFLSFPKQIADQMRGRRFRNFREFRETFWRLVGEDEVLRQAFPSQSNRTRMANGHTPFSADGTKYEINHKLALEHTGEVYDFDNLEILTKTTHDAMRQ